MYYDYHFALYRRAHDAVITRDVEVLRKGANGMY